MRDEQSIDYQTHRESMVRNQLQGRRVDASSVLAAMGRVPREKFLAPQMGEFAYDDSALPIEAGQTISQPYIVALMIEALELKGGEKVLEVGAGSGYAAAVLAEIAGEVCGIERVESLAERAGEVLGELGYDNVEIVSGDGTRGWPDQAPFDGILVSAGGPDVPTSLMRQLKQGGRLVIPVGDRQVQRLLRVTRREDNEFSTEELTRVRFVPLVGDEGWTEGEATSSPRGAGLSSPDRGSAGDASGRATSDPRRATTESLVAAEAQPIETIDTVDLGPLLERIGDARVVLLGESTHGTSEFYRCRARITRELIERKGFDMVAVEADWPDAARIDHYVRQLTTPPSQWRAFTRFPTWMWRNTDMQEFVEWLRRHNGAKADARRRVAFYGLDLYSLYTSIDEVLRYLEGVDPEAAAIARQRYGCLTPWQADPATYGCAVQSGNYRECEDSVVETLMALMENQLDYAARDGERFLDAAHNARLVANAEAYYRSMYRGHVESWNLRDSHMFETLKSLLDHHDAQRVAGQSKVVVWEHNSHIGDARATAMAARGEHNVGQLCRQSFEDGAYLIGFGTHGGTVAAADDWGGPMRVKKITPSMDGSWERLCHQTCIPAFLLGLRNPACGELRRRLLGEQLERAIGVIYREHSERFSHYFQARLGDQFDEFIWFDETTAVTPLDTGQMRGMPETYPFGL